MANEPGDEGEGPLAAALDPSRAGVSIDDVAPDPAALRLWAKACGTDPERLRRLSMARRYPDRSREDFANGSSPFLSARRRQPVCPACFVADRAEARDCFLRARWLLPESCACPVHRIALVDQCSACHAPFAVTFHLQDGSATAVCATCRHELGRGGEGAADAFAAALIDVQHALKVRIASDPTRRARLAETIESLWAPLDEAGAARPVLAIWLGEPNWRCPVEVAQEVGAAAPLARLPVRWRALTLIALGELFGLDLAALEQPSEATVRLLARAAPRPAMRGRPSRQRGSPISVRPMSKYLDLATGILASAAWRAGDTRPERQRQRLLGRLLNQALRPSGSPGRRPAARRTRSEAANRPDLACATESQLVRLPSRSTRNS